MKYTFLTSLFLCLFLNLSACSKSSDTGNSEEPNRPEVTDPGEVRFSLSSQTLGDTRSFEIVIADIDLDGDNDIFVPNYINASLLWINNGEGSFTLHPQQFGAGWTGTHYADIGDLNGDTFPDIILASHDVPSRIYLNNGQNEFTASTQQFGSPGEHPHTVQLADIEGDGDLDAYICNGSSANRFWLNDGNGNFTMKGIAYSGNNTYGKVLADFNGDSLPDMYISQRNGESEIWLNNGNGDFSDSGSRLSGAGQFIHCADIEDDGDIDLVTGTPEIKIFFNDGNATFTPGESFGESATKLALFDADGDGDCDLFTTNIETGNKLWLNDNGTFVSQGVIFGTVPVLSAACADLNNDGRPEVILGLGENSGGNKIYFNISE